jgi:hypothetical protein
MDGGNSAVQRGTLRLSAGMKAGIEVILGAWDKHGASDKRLLAFILATA